MQLEDYFMFLRPDDIRIKGHRIGIESVLFEYLHQAKSPEEIADIFPTLTLEEVYATILYYLRNREQVSKYVADWLAWGQEQREKQKLDKSPLLERLRKLKAARAEQRGVM